MIRKSLLLALTHLASAWTLESICNSDTLTSALPDDAIFGVTLDPSSLIVESITNFTIDSTTTIVKAGSGFDFCNVTFAYSHNGRNDTILVNYFLPTPDDFKNRYLTTGGGGYAINSGPTGPQDGLNYGAVSGRTDGGFGSFTAMYNTNGIDLIANGSLNYDELFLFGYTAIHELTTLGKAFANNVYNISGSKLYSYYEACSEGGREGFSQVQRYGDEFDGALIGAPAFRFSFQQTNHLFAGVAEQTLGYVPSPCEFAAITNATIVACDPLDGRTDGVVSRTDLCLEQFNFTSIIGTPYSCPAQAASAPGVMGPTHGALPAQVGNVSAEAVQLVQTLHKGLHNSQDQQAYFFYQPSSTYDDGIPTAYDNDTGKWEVPISGLGQPFVVRSVDKIESNSLNLSNFTYDTLVYYMYTGYREFVGTLQTDWPDLTPYNSTGGKIIHYHGESDYSIPTASSVRYWNSVREIMYPGMGYNESVGALSEWYRLYLIPGAGHCSPNALEPNGPFPTNTLETLISWVENGTAPEMLPAAVPSGEYQGSQPLCLYPLRPLWDSSGAMECVFSQESIDSYTYDLTAFKIPVY